MPAHETTPPAEPARRRGPRATAEAAPPVASPAVASLSPEPAAAPNVAKDEAVIAAERVDVRLGAVARVESSEVTVHQGAIGAARADRVLIDRGAIGAAVAQEVQLSQGIARNVLAQHVRVEQSFVRSLVAADVTTGGPTGVGILIARKVVGDVKVLLDWRGALAFGAAAGLVAGLVRRVGRGRSGRS